MLQQDQHTLPSPVEAYLIGEDGLATADGATVSVAQALLPDASEVETDNGLSERSRFYFDTYTHSQREGSGTVCHYGKDEDGDNIVFGTSPSDSYFGSNYASWLAIPRLSLQEMPLDWQAMFFGLVELAQEHYGLRVPEHLHIMRRGVKNQWVPNDHWNDYRHGNVRKALAADEKLGLNPPFITTTEEHII